MLFKVWAPYCSKVEIKLMQKNKASVEKTYKDEHGYFAADLPVPAGTRYLFELDGKKERPDPRSNFQPEGVHGPSAVVDHGAFHWSDRDWKGAPDMHQLIFYEMHTGTFTPEGTFEAAAKKIPYLKKLGVTCLEIMPVAQFPGKRNWGYDGVGIYAPQNSYGGPDGLKKLVNACHRAGLAVCLDVVYNHLGPEGNYLNDFGPYFTEKYHTPWGSALNFDGPDCGPVRQFFIDNALYWMRDYHIDVLRLDAVHGIYDFGAKHVLEELTEAVHAQAGKLGRRCLIIGESDLNDSKVIRPVKEGGWALDGQWSDDFHHAVHALVTGEKNGYYGDFGQPEDLQKAMRDGFVYDGRYSNFRKRRHGNSVKHFPRHKLVTYIQNHDQTGNRAFGERLGELASFELQKAAAVLLLFAPHTPLIFMGEEYGETRPFQYFIDHGDPDLIKAVQQGRKKEFEEFGWKEVPDPESPKTFQNSKLDWAKLSKAHHKPIFRLYQDLIKLRKEVFGTGPARIFVPETTGKNVSAVYTVQGKSYRMFCSFDGNPDRVPGRLILTTDDLRYGGRAHSHSPFASVAAV